MQYLETYKTLGRIKGWLYISGKKPRDLEGLGYSIEQIEHIAAESKEGRISDCGFIYRLADDIDMPREYLETGIAPALPHPKAVMLKLASLYHEFFSTYRLVSRVDNKKLRHFVNDKLAQHYSAMTQETFHAYQLDIPETLRQVEREYMNWDLNS